MNKLIITALCALFLITACEKSDLEPTHTNTERDAQLLDISKDVNQILNSEVAFQYLAEKFSEEWGGDYEVLMSTFLNGLSEVTEDVETSEKINQLKLKTASDKKLLLRSTEKNYNDNMSNYSPLSIVVEPEDDQPKTIIGVDESSELRNFDPLQEPDIPFVIVGYCEVCKENGELIEDLWNENSIQTSAEENELSVTTREPRVSGRQETIYYLKTPDLNLIEGWAKGKPELRYNCTLGSGTSLKQAKNITFRPTRTNAKNGHTLWAELFYWYFDSTQPYQNGPDYFVQTFETDDYGATYELTVGATVREQMTQIEVSGSSLKVTYRAKDKVMWGQLITQLDPSPYYENSDAYIHTKIINQ